MDKLWIIIPAKNEADNIAQLIINAAQYGTVIVVNDGSTDNTGQIAQEAGAWHIIDHEVCKGIGLSVVDGWREALDSGAERIIVMDAGGSHRPIDIPILLASQADIVIGSRFVSGSKYYGRLWRRICSQIVALLCNIAQSGKWLHDWSSGFRLYSARAVRRLLAIRYEAKMHAWQIEVLGQARYMRLCIEEVPITYIAGRSSFSWASMLEIIITWLQILHHKGIIQ